MSEAEKKATFEAFESDLVGTTVAVDGIVTTHSEKLTEDGGKDVGRALKAWGWMPAREGETVDDDLIMDKLTGIVVTIDATVFADRPLAREGVESIMDRAERKKWLIVKDPTAE
jgi:hypothetical protein